MYQQSLHVFINKMLCKKKFDKALRGFFLHLRDSKVRAGNVSFALKHQLISTRTSIGGECCRLLFIQARIFYFPTNNYYCLVLDDFDKAICDSMETIKILLSLDSQCKKK